MVIVMFKSYYLVIFKESTPYRSSGMGVRRFFFWGGGGGGVGPKKGPPHEEKSSEKAPTW